MLYVCREWEQLLLSCFYIQFKGRKEVPYQLPFSSLNCSNFFQNSNFIEKISSSVKRTLFLNDKYENASFILSRDFPSLDSFRKQNLSSCFNC